MDFLDVSLKEVGVAVLQELWNKVGLAAKQLVNETEDVVLEKESFREFSKPIAELNTLFQALQARKVEETTGSRPTITALETMHSQLRKACKVIEDYKSGSQLRRFLNSHSVLEQMQELAKEIAETISSLDLANLDAALNLESKTDQIINNLRSMEFRSAAATDAITSEIEKSMSQNGRNRDHSLQLLQKIAEAVGASANASLVQNELALLKQEKEEMEAQKKKAEALQLSQLIQLLYSSELVPSPQEQAIATYRQYSIGSFTCPLCKELMTDPVAIVCGHSFERKAILEHFGRGESTCPTCEMELDSLELTPNLSLRGSIEEWKQRDVDFKFQSAVSGINSNDDDILKKSLDDLQQLMEVPHYRAVSSEKGLIPKMVEIVKANTLNTKAALKCLYYLASYCDDNKEVIVKEGGIRCIVKHFYKGEAEPDAIAILLVLSVNETFAEEIGKAKDCIPLLVSLLHNNNPDVWQKAQQVLQTLSSNTHFVLEMAKAGHFQPFVARFNQGSSETRTTMAAALIKMQLGDNSIKDFEHKQFVSKLVQMLSSSSPACKSACLMCIKKFLAYPRMVKRFLADTTTISLLIGFISSVSSEQHWKQQTTEVLTSLVEATQLSDFQIYAGLQELQSQRNIGLFLQLAATSDHQLKAQILQLLYVLSYKSETARNLVRSDKDAVAKLFSSLNCDQPEVRHWAMKLIYCISKDHTAGVPLPESPAKESAINALVAILTSSTEIKERSTAAGIISYLPTDDNIVDEMLRRSEALKAIQEIICTIDNDFGVRAPVNPGESLLENALAALLRYTQPGKPELQRQVGELELYPSLVRVLSRGSSLAKQRTATALAHLSHQSNLSIIDATIISKQLWLPRLFPRMSYCCSTSVPDLCSVHGSACSSRTTFCLVKADAVRPLVQTLNDTDSGAVEAALMALDTLLTDHIALSHAAAAIVDSQGVPAILEVLEKGSASAKEKALDLFQRILQHTDITKPQSDRSERILIQLLTDDVLKKKVALVLRQMNLLPEQSSYF